MERSTFIVDRRGRGEEMERSTFMVDRRPAKFVAILEKLGIRPGQETEVYHTAHLSNGVHSFGGWLTRGNRRATYREEMISFVSQIASNMD